MSIKKLMGEVSQKLFRKDELDAEIYNTTKQIKEQLDRLTPQIAAMLKIPPVAIRCSIHSTWQRIHLVVTHDIFHQSDISFSMSSGVFQAAIQLDEGIDDDFFSADFIDFMLKELGGK